MDSRPGRPRALSLDLIVEAVLEEGIATFSLPGIASRLGVAHSGLYRYVRDRDELLVLAIEHAAMSVDWPDPDLPWRELLQEVASTIWTICERHPGYEQVARLPTTWPKRIVDQTMPYIASLHRQGFSIEDASVAVEIAGKLALTTSVATSSRDGRSRAERRAWHDRSLAIFLDGLAGRTLL